MVLNIANKKICVVSPGGMGDDMMILPTLSYIRKHSPSTKIEFAPSPGYVSSFWGHDDLNYVIPSKALNNPETRRHYDYVFNFDGAITRNDDAEKLHGVDVSFRWLDADFDLSKLTPEDRIPKLCIPPSRFTNAKKFLKYNSMEDTINIALQLRSSSPIRSWLPEYNRKLGRMLGEAGYKVILFDLSSTWDFTGENVVWARRDMIRDMAEVVGLLSFCDLIIGPDSSFQHIAQALQIPSIGIFGAFPGDFRVRYGPKAESIDCDRDFFKCSPCFYHKRSCPKGNPSPCMESITPEMVFAKVEEMLERFPPMDKAKTPQSKQEFCGFCFGAGEEIKDGFFQCSRCESIFQKGFVSYYDSPKEKTEEELLRTEVNDVEYIDASIDIATRIHAFTEREYRSDGFIGTLYLADILCGAGTLTAALNRLDHRYRVALFDPSRRALKVARDTYGLPVNPFDIFTERDVPLSNFSHMIIMRDILERYSQAEAEILLQKVRQLMIPNGFIFIQGTNALREENKAIYDKRFHLNVASPEGLKMFIETQGFKVTEDGIFELNNKTIGCFARRTI